MKRKLRYAIFGNHIGVPIFHTADPEVAKIWIGFGFLVGDLRSGHFCYTRLDVDFYHGQSIC